MRRLLTEFAFGVLALTAGMIVLLSVISVWVIAIEIIKDLLRVYL